MGMLGWFEIPAKSVNPILRPSQKVLLFFVLITVGMAIGGGHDLGFVIAPVEDGGIVAAMKIHVSHGKELTGEQLPPIAKQQSQSALGAFALAPDERLRLQVGAEAKTEHQQQ
jgi:hypothetical protein